MNDKAILNGKTVMPCDNLIEWAHWIENNKEKKIVAQYRDEAVFVSTVFLGLDHGFGGPPLWFETMIFGGPNDGYQERYQTWDEAATGHEKAMSMVKDE